MPTATSNVEKLRDAEMIMLHAFNEAAREDIFGDIARIEMDVTDGYARFVAQFANARFQEVTGTVTPGGVDWRDITVETVAYVNAIEIGLKAWNNASSISGNAIRESFEQLGEPFRLLGSSTELAPS